MEKLELTHLAHYLPYGLIMEYNGNENAEIKVALINLTDRFYSIPTAILSNFKPILRPLSDYSDLSGNAMNDLNCDVSNQITINEYATGYIGIGQVDYETILIMAENHIDMFKLIPNNLAIDIKTLSK